MRTISKGIPQTGIATVQLHTVPLQLSTLLSTYNPTFSREHFLANFLITQAAANMRLRIFFARILKPLPKARRKFRTLSRNLLLLLALIEMSCSVVVMVSSPVSSSIASPCASRSSTNFSPMLNMSKKRASASMERLPTNLTFCENNATNFSFYA